jgi:hypothetical protein
MTAPQARLLCDIAYRYGIDKILRLRRRTVLKIVHFQRGEEHQNLTLLKIAHRNATMSKYFKLSPRRKRRSSSIFPLCFSDSKILGGFIAIFKDEEEIYKDLA